MIYLSNCLTLFTSLKETANKITHLKIFYLSLLFTAATIVVTYLHYHEQSTFKSTLWIFWLLSMGCFTASFLPSKNQILDFWRLSSNKAIYLIILLTIILYFPFRLLNFSTSPWNSYGLFDDAAWDIFHAKKWILFSGLGYQASFLDTVITRESIFHYYITALFELFGYNVLTFNMGLLFLGFVTVLFTTFTIHKIFNHALITAACLLIMLTIPLHVTQTFMGHRYAIAMPLMMISYYYLVSGFKDNSALRASVGGIFAGLCINGAHMGKQYTLALLVSAFITLLFSKNNKPSTQENGTLAWTAFIGLVISLIPMFFFIYFNKIMYFNREKGLVLQGLFLQYQQFGFDAITTALKQLTDLIFAPLAYSRQFMNGYPILPYVFWVLLIPGFFIVLKNRRWEILIMSFLPPFICFLTVSYDFRIQIALPFWIISIFYSVNALLNYLKNKPPALKHVTLCGIISLISVGVVSSIKYDINLSKSPNAIYFLPHVDVAFARITKDIVLGNEQNPSIAMTRDEFNLPNNLNTVSYNTLVCPFKAFAIAHLFFQNVDDVKTLSFCDQIMTFILGNPQTILDANLKALNEYQDNGKDLVLIWEVADNVQPVINLFSQFTKYGYDKTFSYEVDGISSKIWMLKIKNANLPAFLSDVKQLRL